MHGRDPEQIQVHAALTTAQTNTNLRRGGHRGDASGRWIHDRIDCWTERSGDAHKALFPATRADASAGFRVYATLSP